MKTYHASHLVLAARRSVEADDIQTGDRDELKHRKWDSNNFMELVGNFRDGISRLPPPGPTRQKAAITPNNYRRQGSLGPLAAV